MHKRYDPIRQALRDRYRSVPGDVLDAIMQDTLEMTKQLDVELEMIARIRFGSCDSAGYPEVFFEQVEGFDPDKYANNSDVCLGSKAVVGRLIVSREGFKGPVKAIICPEVDLLPYPEGTPVYVLKPRAQ